MVQSTSVIISEIIAMSENIEISANKWHMLSYDMIFTIINNNNKKKTPHYHSVVFPWICYHGGKL